MNAYKNPWHKPTAYGYDDTYGPEIYRNNASVHFTARGFTVYKLNDKHYDYVYNGVCITQRAGASNPGEVIDSIIAGDSPLNERAHEYFRAALPAA